MNDKDNCSHCGNTGIEPGTIVIYPGGGSGFNSLDPDPLNRGSYVPCKKCHGRNAQATIAAHRVPSTE